MKLKDLSELKFNGVDVLPTREGLIVVRGGDGTYMSFWDNITKTRAGGIIYCQTSEKAIMRNVADKRDLGYLINSFSAKEWAYCEADPELMD